MIFWTQVTTALRFYIVLQGVMLTLKIDAFIGWSWKAIFWVSWIILLIVMFYAIGLLIITMCTAVYMCYGEAQAYQTKGLMWILVVTAGAGLNLLMFLLGIVEYYDLQETNRLRFGFLILSGLSGFLLLFGLKERNELRLFIEKMYINDEEVLTAKNTEVNHEVQFKQKSARNLPPFLKKLTSTYFQRPAPELIHKRLLKKFQAKLKSKPKPTKTPPAPQKSVSARPARTADTSKERVEPNKSQTFRKEDEGDRSSHSCPRTNTSNTTRYVPMKTPKDQLMDPKSLNPSTINSPHNVSFRSDGNNQCLVCFEKPPDAVFMECGHGGVCYECALEIWKKTEECYLCRGRIDHLLTIDPKMTEDGMIRILAATEMVKFEMEEEDYQTSDPPTLGGNRYAPEIRPPSSVPMLHSNILEENSHDLSSNTHNNVSQVGENLHASSILRDRQTSISLTTRSFKFHQISGQLRQLTQFQ
eukprot:TRINITY_DN12507_c0_g1_i1.p1 TRINITY_DN12507_c0_g1~~TRINITY_DN12507_c0_g1_i1.p1  ORF type:complete len:472 (-),score=32.29 TRINITY_DN12507_c0_g1_i1:282-1697(-)